jgi:hypothetical protein
MTDREDAAGLPEPDTWNADANAVTGNTAEVPDHPGHLLPSPWTIKDAYYDAIAEIDHHRSREPTSAEYGQAVQQAAFWAFFSAVTDTLWAIVREHHPEIPRVHERPAPAIPPLHVVASGPGSGKTTLAKAFMAVLVRVTDGDPLPVGCALLVHHIETAEHAYRDLSMLLPGRVAVFTTEHDADRPISAGREHRYFVDDLERHPAIVVTHQFYQGIRGEKARCHTRNGLTFPRMVTFIDEKVNEVQVHDVDRVTLSKVHRSIQKEDHGLPELEASFAELVKFANEVEFGERSLETPLHDRQGWREVVQATQWLRTETAAQYERSRSRRTGLPFEAVFGFARCLAAKSSFIVRKNGGKNGFNLVGYESALPQVPGMVLLDATADIDGVSALCPWRKHADLPSTRYDRLEIIHVESVVEGIFSRWWHTPANRQDYVRHICDVVLRHVQPGQRALLVCMKDVVHANDLANWSEHVACFANGSTRDFAWDFDGRLLSVAWWGGYGVAANDWRLADVVLLFDDFHLPRHTLIATAQGLRGHTAIEGAIVTMAANGGRTHPDVDTLREAHILRWVKQMAMRGRARESDHRGVCGHQKLVVTGDPERLLEQLHRLFPGAKFSMEPSATERRHGKLMKLAEVLLARDLPNNVSTKEVGNRLGVEWRDIISDLKRHKRRPGLITAAGWEYVPGRGRRGGHFERIGPGEAQANGQVQDEGSGVTLEGEMQDFS